MTVNSYKCFKKYLSFTYRICDFSMRCHIMFQTLCISYYETRKELKIRDSTYNKQEFWHISDAKFFLCFIIWVFVFQHSAFSTRTCDINGFCFVCSRVYFKDISLNSFCKNMFLGVYFKQTAQHDLQIMFLENNSLLFNFDVCLLNQKRLCAAEAEKNGCMFYKTCNSPRRFK